MAIGVIALAARLPDTMTASAIESARSGNMEVAEQIKLTRGYYTENVVAKAQVSGAFVPKFDHRNDPGAIPLPATFVLDMSERLRGSDRSVDLISPYRWPHRGERQMDGFQRDAWQAFQKSQGAVFTRLEAREGQRFLRVAVADVLDRPACVNCHNTEASSPRRDWKLGDVRGVMEVTRRVEPLLAQTEQRARTLVAIAAGAALAIACILFAGAAMYSRARRRRREADRSVRFLAHHDPMTGALNRTRFLSLISEALDDWRGAGMALHYIDLDGFKDVNDRFGHGVGDDLIRAAAGRLQTFVRPGCLLARLGGDEFVFAQTDLGSSDEAIRMAEAIVASLARPFRLQNHRVAVSASVGVATDPITLGGAERLLEAADTALYQAKSEGRNRAVLFTPEMSVRLHARRRLETRLRICAPEDLFDLYFQPILGRDLKLAGFEALLRLPDGAGGFIPPSDFIPLAEKTGAIAAIGAWVVRRACKIATEWPDHLIVAVNLSPAQFGETESVRSIVENALADSGLPPRRLELEITEGLLFEASDEELADLAALRALGVSIALDDFGSGYSSLGYLWRLPLDKLKVDRSFIAAPASARAATAPILDAIVALGRTLRVTVSAEGVETEEHERLCARLGCDFVQGYRYSAAVPAADLGALILREFSDDLGAPDAPGRDAAAA